ncbi:MAG: NAD(P)/FAD-dependent oxidoreductase [Anaerolineae bacterium]|nr:NAD(P)/FAD-dependent oxidoreductase [Anaerolineae bacterium]
MKQYLIIGNGAAGLSAAEAIRQRDPQGRITIITNEPHLFYSRPGIAYLVLGEVSEKQLISRQASFYRENRLELLHAHVVELNLAQQTISLENGKRLAYDVLLLATGSTAVPASFPGGDLQGVLTFDTLNDAREVIKRGRKAKTAVVVGGGITALELAEGLRHQGAKTHLLQRGRRIWSRLFDEMESAIIEEQIRHEKIEIHYHENITEVVGKRGKVASVKLESGASLKCQVVGVAIGVRPNVGLVNGLPVNQDQGILVNPYLQSNVPTLFAAGDVAQVYDRWTQAYHLDILWPSAISEGRAAGHNMVEIANGRSPNLSYQKGTPFNAALLFGVHVTIMGRMGQQVDAGENVSHLSRGSSHVWTAPFTTRTQSAWDKKGPHSVRLVVANGRIVGALLMGNQALADPLRDLIEQEIDISEYEADLFRENGRLPEIILEIYQTKQSGE